MKQIKIRPEFEAIVSDELKSRVASANRYIELEDRLSKYEAGDTSVMDEELFAYIMRHHDWYADYSDDGSVYRAAHKLEQFFDSIVENCPKLAGMLETAKATRRSPQLDGVEPYKVFFQPLEMLCLDSDDTDPISVERWMLLAQFRRGLNMLVDYYWSVDGAKNVWYIDGEKAREYTIKDNGVERPLLTIALPQQIQRQLDVSADVIVKYFEIMLEGDSNKSIGLGDRHHYFQLNIFQQGNPYFTTYNLVHQSGKVAFAFIV